MTGEGNSPLECNPADLLGVEDPGSDWKLDPQAHAAKLLPEAAALRRVLEHSAIREIMDRYSRADERANGYQRDYKRLGRWDVYLATAAALLGAVILTLTDTTDGNGLFAAVRPVLLGVQILSAGGVAAIKFYTDRTHPFIDWQKQRSLAETARVELFETVAGMAGRNWKQEEHPGDCPLLPLQLEYFVRYQLNVQLNYYDGRGRQHARAAKRYVGTGAIITFVAAVAAAIVATGYSIGDLVSVASIAALLAPIMLTAQTSLSRLNQDERNAARYEITYRHLRKRSANLTDVRRKALEDDPKGVHEFIRLNHEVMSVEHSEWIAQQAEKKDTGVDDAEKED